MGNVLLSVFIISFLVLSNSVFSAGLIDVNDNREILLALEIAADAGATQWDEDVTAEAGIIVLNESEAEYEAIQKFKENVLEQSKVNLLDIEIVNNAPVTKVVDGTSIHFQSNGIIVSYGNYSKIREVDDRK